MIVGDACIKKSSSLDMFDMCAYCLGHFYTWIQDIFHHFVGEFFIFSGHMFDIINGTNELTLSSEFVTL